MTETDETITPTKLTDTAQDSGIVRNRGKDQTISCRHGRLRQRDPKTGRLFRVISTVPKLTSPPKALKRAKLDNIALVPGNLLPFKAKYQEIANRLPDGEMLIVVPPSEHPQRLLLERVASLLRAEGHSVTIVSADRVQ